MQQLQHYLALRLLSQTRDDHPPRRSTTYVPRAGRVG